MYRAPLKDIRFVLHRLVGYRQLSGYSGLEDYTPEHADSVLEEAATFAERVLKPINAVGDRHGAQWTPEGVRMPDEFKAAYGKFV